jgi:hypothetical protein
VKLEIKKLEDRVNSLEPKPPAGSGSVESWSRIIATLTEDERMQVYTAMKLYNTKKVEEMTEAERDQLADAIMIVEKAQK